MDVDPPTTDWLLVIGVWSFERSFPGWKGKKQRQVIYFFPAHNVGPYRSGTPFWFFGFLGPRMEPCILHVFQWMMVEHKAMNIWHFALHLLICWTAWGWWTFGWVQRVLQLDTRLHRWYVYIYIYIRHVNCVPICCFSSIGDELNLTSVNYHAEVRWIIRAHLRPGPQKFNTDTKKWPLFISYPSLFSGGVVCSYFSIGLAL